jgi:hypothetical protein
MPRFGHHRPPIAPFLAGFAAICLLSASCAHKPVMPTAGPIYSRSAVRTPAGTPPPDARSLAGAESLRSRTLLTLGPIEYDGLILPLIAPDARFIATQLGPTPDWRTILAERDAPQPPGEVRILRIAPDQSTPLLTTHTLPRGIILGRAANARGFLIEQPAPAADDASRTRRIGLAEWETGHIDWLTDDATDCAFGVLGPRGELAFSQRTPGDSQWSLILRDADGIEHIAALSGASIVFPQIVRTSRGLIVFAFIVPDAPGASLTLCAYVLESGVLSLAAAAPLATSATLFDAFQCVAGSQPLIEDGEGGRDASLITSNAATDSVAVATLSWAGAGSGKARLSLEPLLAGTFAATLTRHTGRRGVVACTLADTFYQHLGQLPRTSGQSPAPPALVWPEPGVIRRTNSPQWPYFALFMESSSTDPRLRAVLISGESPSPSPQEGIW